MRLFAIAVFALHTLAETVFGLRGFISGSFSWQAGLDPMDHAAQISGSARFLASGLLTLAALGAAVLAGPGVQSSLGKLAAGLLALFHCLGVVGVLLTASGHPGMLATSNAIGAMTIHGVLGLGFLIVVLGHSRMQNRTQAAPNQP